MPIHRPPPTAARAAMCLMASLLTAALAAPPAFAAPCDSTDDCDRAAKAAFAAGRLEDALALWKRAQAHGPSAGVEFSIANALAFLDHVDEAIAAFERFVETHRADPRHPLAVRLLGQLRARSRATLHIESDIAGTPVIVRDALHSQSGVTPLSREVDPRATVHVRFGTPPDPAQYAPLPDYRPWAVAGLATGVGLAALAGTFAWLAEVDRDEADDLTERARREGAATAIRVSDVDARLDSAAVNDGLALGAGALAVAALTAGGLLLWLDARLPAEGAIRVGPAGVAAGWRF